MNIERNEEQHRHDDIPAIGLLLQKARLDLGMTDEEVAERLKLRVSVVRDIEAMKGEESQITTFTRGYIRSYAKLVGLDVDYLLNSNNHTGQVEPVEHQLQSFSKKTSDEKLDNRVMVLTWFIFAIVIGITMFWWWQNQKQGQWPSTEIESADLVTEVVADNAETKENADGISLITSSSSGTNSIQTNGIDLEQLDPKATSLGTKAAKTEASLTSAEDKIKAENANLNQTETGIEALTALTENQAQSIESNDGSNKDLYTALLSMSFTADCWVDVVDANGKRILTGVKSAGETIELSGDMPYKLVIGAPRAVKLMFEGEVVDLSRYSSRQVARFSLPN